jgi:hypothetical protein
MVWVRWQTDNSFEDVKINFIGCYLTADVKAWQASAVHYLVLSFDPIDTS